MKSNELKDFWSQRYRDERTGWDLGHPSKPLIAYFDQLTHKSIDILIPGAGNSYEAEYLFNSGFPNIYVLDIADHPLKSFANRNPKFPKNQLICDDFFKHEGQYDLIVEQTFFCSFPPEPSTRHLYANKMNELLKPNGKLIGLWFDIPLTGDMIKRPFGGDKVEYLKYFSPLFEIMVFERCYNSEPSRINSELFGLFKKKV